MGYRIEATKDSQFPGSLTYPQASLQRLGQYEGMHTGRKRFRAGDATILPNGDITLVPPIPCDNRLKTPTQAVPFKRPNPQSCLDPATGAQTEPIAGSMTLSDINPHSLCDTNTALSEIANCQPPQNPNGTNKEPLEPILTPDTYLLTTHAGKAKWTQLGNITMDTRVVQSLPSGQIEDLGGALVTTIESICHYQLPTGETALVRLGMACVAAYLHIKIEEEWMTALQATQRGHGTLLCRSMNTHSFSAYASRGEETSSSTPPTQQSKHRHRRRWQRRDTGLTYLPNQSLIDS